MPTAFKLFAMQLLAKAIRATTVTSRDLPAGYLPAGYDFNPRELFSASEQGIWLDPSDFSTMFQDAAGTTPVTALGQPVGKILDKSGRGNHASQTTSASRPTLQQDSNGLYYLSFDGTDDGMATPSIDFTGTDKMTVWVGVRKLSDAALGVLVEPWPTSYNNGHFAILAPIDPASLDFSSRTRGTLLTSATASGIAAPITSVLCADMSISDDRNILRVNGVQAASSVDDQGTGNYGNYPLYIGRRGGTTFPFNGRIYQLIIRGAASNVGQIAAGEAYVNSKTRAY